MPSWRKFLKRDIRENTPCQINGRGRAHAANFSCVDCVKSHLISLCPDSARRAESIVYICIQMYIHIASSTRARTCHLAKLVACTRVACVSRSERTGVQLSSRKRREKKSGSPRVHLRERCKSSRAISSVPENCRGCVHVEGRITSACCR